MAMTLGSYLSNLHRASRWNLYTEHASTFQQIIVRLVLDPFLTLPIKNPQKNKKYRLMVVLTFSLQDSEVLIVNRRGGNSWFKIYFTSKSDRGRGARTSERVDRKGWEEVLDDGLNNMCLENVSIHCSREIPDQPRLHHVYHRLFYQDLETRNFVGFGPEEQRLLAAPLTRLTYRQCEELMDDIGAHLSRLRKIDPDSKCYLRFRKTIKQLNDKYEAVKSLCLNPDFVAKHYYPQAQGELETTLKRRKTTSRRTSKRQRTKR
jgi:hypothetical protein